ncbi:hypothetical protein V6N11_017654 [Hibiscus sabdariffa]|uniref:Uncharacterized protein n=1 Tax=Hibiscus sabdariffa TaxID=183260 RepID=A0ABR2TYY9_9ROSI
MEADACTFADLLDANGEWDIGKLSSMVIADAISHIISFKSPNPHDMEDMVVRCWSKRHNFEVSSAYSHITTSPWDVKEKIWDLIWKKIIPQRVRIFLWLTCRQRLMTNSERCRRGLGTSAVCPRCHMADESILHTLRDCVESKEAWLQLFAPDMRRFFFQQDLHSWLRCNLCSHIALSGSDIPWRILFASLLWQLWKNQNDLVFNNSTSPVESLVQKSLALARYFNEPLKQFSNLKHRMDQHHVWSRPPLGWICLNVDGDVSSSTCIGSAGEFFRDNDGGWILGFGKLLGVTSPLIAELWAIYIGLKIAWDNGFEYVQIQSDCLGVVKLLLDPN